MSSHYDSVRDLVSIILNSVSQELQVPTDELSIEVESVVTCGVIEAYKRGIQDQSASNRPTMPAPPRNTPRVPTPRPRKYRK